MRANTAYESNLKPSSSMFNLPDIPKKMHKTFASPFRKLRNTFSRPSTPKGKAGRSQTGPSGRQICTLCKTLHKSAESCDVNKN